MAARQVDAREARFIDEYLIDLDPKRAAIAAGYSASLAASKAYQWVSNGKVKPHVFAEVERRQKILAAKTGITQERVLAELAKIGFSDIRKAVRWSGNLVTEEDNEDGGDVLVIKTMISNRVELIDSDLLDDATAAAVSQITQNVTGGVSLKMHDKRAALVDIGRHLGMFTDKVEHTGGITIVMSQADGDL